MKLMIKPIILSMLSSTLFLNACDKVEDQDVGVSELNYYASSALVFDSYLDSCTGFLDTNENNVLDSWEERSLSELGEFQLNTLEDPDKLVLSCSQGYDSFTWENFRGFLSARVGNFNTLYDAGLTQEPLTPLTTLFSYMPLDAVERQIDLEIDTAANASQPVTLTSQDFYRDYLADLASTVTDADRFLIANASAIQRIADIMSAHIMDLAEAHPDIGWENSFGQHSKLPSDATHYAYQSLGLSFSANPETFRGVLTNPGIVQVTLDTAIDLAEVAINNVLGFEDDEDLIDLGTPSVLTPTDIVNFYNNVTDLYITQPGLATNQDQVKALYRGVDIAAILIGQAQSAQELQTNANTAFDLLLNNTNDYRSNLEQLNTSVNEQVREIALANGNSLAVENIVMDEVSPQFLKANSAAVSSDGNLITLRIEEDAGEDSAELIFEDAATEGELNGEIITDSLSVTGEQESILIENGRWQLMNDYAVQLYFDVLADAKTLMLRRRVDDNGSPTDTSDDEEIFYLDLDDIPVQWLGLAPETEAALF